MEPDPAIRSEGGRLILRLGHGSPQRHDRERGGEGKAFPPLKALPAKNLQTNPGEGWANVPVGEPE